MSVLETKGMISKMKGESRENQLGGAEKESKGRTKMAQTSPHSSNKPIKGKIMTKGGKAYETPRGAR